MRNVTQPHRGATVKLPTYGKGGLRVGVNLDDSAALLQLMERNRYTARRVRAISERR